MPDPLTGQSLELNTLLTDPGTEIVAHLSKHPISLDGGALLIGDITECDFPGYAAQLLAEFTMMDADSDDHAEALSDPITFKADVIVTPQDAYALYLTLKLGAGEAVIWRVFPLGVPFTFDVKDRQLTKVVRLRSFDDAATPVDSDLAPVLL